MTESTKEKPLYVWAKMPRFEKHYLNEAQAINARPEPLDDVAAAIHTIYDKNEFAGMAFAVAPRIVLTAGHHYNAKADEVGDFTIQSVKSGRKARVDYAQKFGEFDILILWLDRDVPYAPLYAFFPPPETMVSTVWCKSTDPRTLITSPGEVQPSKNPSLCEVRGTVSAQGSSGAPVIDGLGELIVGMHIAANTKEGSRISEFVPSKVICQVLASLEVDLTAPYPPDEEDEEEEEEEPEPTKEGDETAINDGVGHVDGLQQEEAVASSAPQRSNAALQPEVSMDLFSGLVAERAATGGGDGAESSRESSLEISTSTVSLRKHFGRGAGSGIGAKRKR